MKALPILLGSSMTVTALAQTRLPESTIATRSEVIAQHGMACTSQPLATQVAVDVLKAGGTAVDAAIAANATIGLMEPTGNGVGGDLFAIVWDGNKLHGLNATGRSPRELTLDHFQEQGLDRVPSFGPLSVSVPGCVDGWCELHERFGKLSLKKILAPAIRYAREGFPVSPVIAEGWAGGGEHLKEYPGFAETFMPGGKAPRAGEVFRNPGLADTLDRIARRGRKGFYEGEVAQRIAEYMARQGGFLSEQDLVDHRSDWVEPISTDYRGYDVWELPPNGQGIAALQILNVLEAYDLASMGFGSTEYMHLFTEAKKLAFEDRARYYADPDFFSTPVERLVSKEYAAERRALISLEKAADRYAGGLPQLETGDTIYLTVADERGMMVSLIQSNYRGFGSGMTPEGLGFVLQNRGELFDLTPGRPNSYAPRKRPFHTIIPAFVTKEGQPWMSFGVMGGDMQPQGHVQVLVNLIDFGMSLQEAGDAPRMHHVGSSEPTGERMTDGGSLNLEPGFAPEVVEALQAKGHTIGEEPTAYFGGFQGILWDAVNRVYLGASESRKDGQAAGY
jgi:gamma-glutamyltranspeptidase/glutathione hydrolase